MWSCVLTSIYPVSYGVASQAAGTLTRVLPSSVQPDARHRFLVLFVPVCVCFRQQKRGFAPVSFRSVRVSVLRVRSGKRSLRGQHINLNWIDHAHSDQIQIQIHTLSTCSYRRVLTASVSVVVFSSMTKQ